MAPQKIDKIEDVYTNERLDRIERHLKEYKDLTMQDNRNIIEVLNILKGSSVDGSGLVAKVNRHELDLDVLDKKISTIEIYIKQLTWVVGVVGSGLIVIILSYLFKGLK